MSKKGFSSTVFWARHIGLAAIIVMVAFAVFFIRQEQRNVEQPEGAPVKRNIATGLSNFYRDFRQSSKKPITDGVGDFTIELAPSEEPLEARLQSMSSDLKPVIPGWSGEHKFRTFEAGSTLRNAISNYAQQEGMQVVWDLNEDFVVKHQFQMDDNMMGSIADIAKAIDSNFNGTVTGYFCPKQRSLVITTDESEYLRNECRVAK